MNDLALPEVKEPKMTFKQKKWLKLFLETGNATQAALKSYETDDPGSASVIASENLAKLKAPIKTYLEMNGFGLKHLLAVLAGGLNAKKIHGSLTEPDREVDDWPTRHKYLETASRWLGVGTETTPTQTIDKAIIFNIQPDEK